ncbi:hypothetical protein CPAST_c19850 [Clostridium pasteurianum DSM 525 = ATCC 6013]|uniref:Uncharacterized protein n=2 Tax=Clostridium pasteurianum TaxID=1501 RepID=A0A0H3J9X2_CLOPA|nr:hypothetical protein [Clostridium pasteurianum]AJA48055.1 hypothetical protein CPAST_c19850 [Clostridium pasteurianum DSM 525 = ATCC 6013]AJA52043.1 hypothetical protein CLPA_c19850 [Clostridium pasteurianum DSM 525 = ATCC 6013]KRU11947.1 hypothetical protein CP6013_01194 [Clostridium pasteurianum DSM 525 = ATCC 6013]UZW16218.1 hypothetical protein OSC52_10485 [Clostridium pasteurianum]
MFILMFVVGCSNTNKNSGNQQSSTTNGNSQNNKSPDAASSDDEAKDAIVRTVSGKGAENSVAKDTAGSASDIKERSLVYVWGNKDGDTVTAKDYF